jgi:hypothetical protein
MPPDGGTSAQVASQGKKRARLLLLAALRGHAGSTSSSLAWLPRTQRQAAFLLVHILLLSVAASSSHARIRESPHPSRLDRPGFPRAVGLAPWRASCAKHQRACLSTSGSKARGSSSLPVVPRPADCQRLAFQRRRHWQDKRSAAGAASTMRAGCCFLQGQCQPRDGK